MTLSLLGREIVRHRSPICYSLNMRNPLKHKKTIPFWLLGITAAAYGAALGYLYARQDKLVFQPSVKHPLRHLFMEKYGERAREYAIEGESVLKGWWVDSVDESDTVVIYFGGNAENIDTVIFLASNIPEVTMVSMHYRGYGMSEGKPSETGLFADALRIVDHVSAAHPDKRIVLFGRSLGSGVALYAAAKRPGLVEHVILTTPYDSISRVAKRHYGWVPVHALLRHKFDSLVSAPHVVAPTTIIVAAKDEYIPEEHPRNLAKALVNTTVTWHEVEAADHTTIHDWNQTWRYVREALHRSTSIVPAPLQADAAPVISPNT